MVCSKDVRALLYGEFGVVIVWHNLLDSPEPGRHDFLCNLTMCRKCGARARAHNHTRTHTCVRMRARTEHTAFHWLLSLDYISIRTLQNLHLFQAPIASLGTPGLPYVIPRCHKSRRPAKLFVQTLQTFGGSLKEHQP